MPDPNLPRCGDIVHHRPTGENWVVAWAEGEHLAPAGWPACRALVADCDLVERATDEEHRRSVAGWERSQCDDGRRARVLRLYGCALRRRSGQ